MYYKNKRVLREPQAKLVTEERVIFNPKWSHYEEAGWKLFPAELESVDHKYIKWVDGDPVEMSQAEKDAVDAAEKAQRIEHQTHEVVRLYQEVEESNTTSIGTVMLMQWSQAGFPKAVAVAEWFTALYDERDAKLAQLSDGVEVDPTPSMTIKPYTFREMREEATP